MTTDDFDRVMAEEWTADANGLDLVCHDPIKARGPAEAAAGVVVGRLATFSTPWAHKGSSNDTTRAAIAVLGKRALALLLAIDRCPVAHDLDSNPHLCPGHNEALESLLVEVRRLGGGAAGQSVDHLRQARENLEMLAAAGLVTPATALLKAAIEHAIEHLESRR